MTGTAPFGTFFLPGPTEVRADVLQAMTQPMISHRGSKFEALFKRVQQGLQRVFVTERPVFVSTSSATGMMEAGVRCAPEGRVLSLVNGAFSERFAHIAETCSRTVDRYVVEWGSVHDLDEVAARLASAEYAAVTVVHSETSTGARNDVRGITERAHQHGAVCLIDSVSGVGGAELRFDEWGLDYVLTGSQKALALPPGLAFSVASENFVQQLRNIPAARSGRGVYFDLLEFETYVLKHQAPNTPAISLYYALDAQLQSIVAEGMEARWARHLQMSDATSQWVAATRDSLGLDVRVLADSGNRSPTVTTVMLPDGITGGKIASATEEQGVTIGTGYGKLKQSSIRIGHMGDHTLATLRVCLDACTAALTAAKSS